MLTAEQHKVTHGTYYHPETSDEVINTLERVRQNGSRIRLDYGNAGQATRWIKRMQ